MPSHMSPAYLLTAASGNIGKRLIPLLLAQPLKPIIVLPTSNPDRLRAQLGATVHDNRIKVNNGDIKDPIFLETILKSYSVTAAFICLTGEDELMVTLNVFDALKRAQTVKHLVYLSACGNFDLDAIQAGLLRNIAAGHVLVKSIIEAKLRYGLPPRSEPGGFSWTILGPSLFFTNDLRSKKNILEQGFFDEPLGSKGVSRADPQDIAVAASNALQDDGQAWAGKKVMVGSLKRYTNVDAAKLWSDALGIQVTPAMSDENGLAAFEQHYRMIANTTWARDMRLMYEMFEAQGFGMTEDMYQQQVSLLGKTPASYEEFIDRTAEEWLANRSLE